jgi:hypothetical protein
LSFSKRLSDHLESKRLTLESLRLSALKSLFINGPMNSRATYKRFLTALFRFIETNDLLEYNKSSMKKAKSGEKLALDPTLEEVLKVLDMTDKPEQKLAWSLMTFDGLPREVLGLFYEDFGLNREKPILKRKERRILVDATLQSSRSFLLP